jgi:hypothetical protein
MTPSNPDILSEINRTYSSHGSHGVFHVPRRARAQAAPRSTQQAARQRRADDTAASPAATATMPGSRRSETPAHAPERRRDLADPSSSTASSTTSAPRASTRVALDRRQKDGSQEAQAKGIRSRSTGSPLTGWEGSRALLTISQRMVHDGYGSLVVLELGRLILSHATHTVGVGGQDLAQNGRSKRRGCMAAGRTFVSSRAWTWTFSWKRSCVVVFMMAHSE